MDSDAFLDEVLQRIRHLPPEEQVEQMLALIECALRQMTPDTIREFRAAVLQKGHHCDPSTDSVLNLVDGHLALRELSNDRRSREKPDT